MPTWIKVILNILLSVALVMCSIAITLYTDTFDKNKKYTYRDLEEAYETGYAKASATVADLQAKINKLEQEKQTIIANYENILTEKDIQKEAEIAELNAEIERLKAELEIYSNQELDFVYVTFYVDNEVYKTVSVRKEGSILVDIEEPLIEVENTIFAGWSNNANIVDIKTYNFLENTNLYAVFEEMPLPNGIYSIFFTYSYDNALAVIPGLGQSVKFDVDISFSFKVHDNHVSLLSGDGEIFEYKGYNKYLANEKGEYVYDENYELIIDEFIEVPRAFGYRFLYDNQKCEVLIGYNTSLTQLYGYSEGWNVGAKDVFVLISNFTISNV